MLKDWSDWSGNIPNGGCADQIRSRDYNKSIEWIERETCDGLEYCPAIRKETRTKCEWRKFVSQSFFCVSFITICCIVSSTSNILMERV